MSFFTSLTGLRAANTDLSVTSNNIANVGTTGFKKSKAAFGDIYARSPLQTATVGQGVALKSIRQEFSQGSIEFSSNTLDLAITGDGFFPLESQDGQTRVYSRSGAFVLSESGNIVNRSGQRLLASTVDATGNAAGGSLQSLSIRPTTAGEAKATQGVDLMLNLPADANVINLPFNPDDPNTYNKTSVIDVFDAGGKSYPATVFFVKVAAASDAGDGGSTYNPTANIPSSKWQTYVMVDDVLASPTMQQAKNAGGEGLYVNEYGEIKPFSSVSDDLLNVKTKKFTLGGLETVQASVPAKISGAQSPYDLGLGNGFNFFNDLAEPDGVFDNDSLSNFLQVDVDSSGQPVTIDLSAFAQIDAPISGARIASEIQNQLRESFGDTRFFDLTTASDREFQVNVFTGAQQDVIAIDLANSFPDVISQTSVRTSDLVDAIQNQIDDQVGEGLVAVNYSVSRRNFSFVAQNPGTEITLEAGASGINNLFNLGANQTALDDSGFDLTGKTIIPNGEFIRPADAQRFGMNVSFNAATGAFEFASGTTGDGSSIRINLAANIGGGEVFNEEAANFLGLPVTAIDPELFVMESPEALRGLNSLPAILSGSPVGLNVDEVFSVTSSNNLFKVAVDGVRGDILVPEGVNYTIDTFTQALEKQINSLADDAGNTVAGVTVNFNNVTKSLVFTGGTTGNSSSLKVTGDAIWGLAETDTARGETVTWIKPDQATEFVNGATSNVFIDEFGRETTDPTGFVDLPAWSPIFLEKGELTFDKMGNLISPAGGMPLDTIFLGGGGSLDLNINFSGSTQFNQAFNVRAQSQDGLPEGDLVGIDIGDDGLITASYSNGSQTAVGKVLLANFPSVDGLNPRGDSSFLRTANSGAPILGEAGSSAFGSIRAGALERSNVDLTAELVGLITAQRNFQANAKALETSSTLTSTILNI